MTETLSDAFVLFGAKGDLAYKKTFPALQSTVKRGSLNVPVIAVARGNWGQLRMKASRSTGAESIRQLLQGSSLLRCVAGDYVDPATFVQICEQLS